MQDYVERAAKIIQTIKLHNLLDLPDQIDVEFEDRESDENGHFVASACIIDAIIYVNPRWAQYHFEETIIHELIHIEQAHVGLLSYPEGSNDYQWGDRRYSLPKTRKEYLNFPWERDARYRTPRIARQVKKILKKEENSVKLSGNC